MCRWAKRDPKFQCPNCSEQSSFLKWTPLGLLEKCTTTVREIHEALEALVRYVDKQTCSHEETYRGGTMWEICSMCGKMWADDEGGRPEYEDPPEVATARKLIGDTPWEDD